jgi:hypothetical protein
MDEGMRSALQRQAAAQAAACPPLMRRAATAAAGAQPLRGAAGPRQRLHPGDAVRVALHHAAPARALAKLQSDYEAAWEPVLRSAACQAGRLKGRVKLARLLIFGALNWSVQWFDRRKGATLDDLTDAAMALVPSAGQTLHDMSYRSVFRPACSPARSSSSPAAAPASAAAPRMNSPRWARTWC